MPTLPDSLVYPLEPFAESFREHAEIGEARLRESSVVFVGLVRNCAEALRANLVRLAMLAESCREWKLHIETNDNEDATDQVLVDFCAAHRQATFTSQRLGRQQFSTEFAGRRTEALAEYRSACQRWVRENAADADLVAVIDWDAAGGWSHAGVLNGVGWLTETPDSYGMASVSLARYPQLAIDTEKKPVVVESWVHYDAWALRLNSNWDDYTAGMGGWKHQWIPPVGSPPVPVVSAFGGMCIYRTADYLAGTYDGSDCEHVPMHRSIAEATGRCLHINPSQRMVMGWGSDDGG